jgi:hypothetical protein
MLRLNGDSLVVERHATTGLVVCLLLTVVSGELVYDGSGVRRVVRVDNRGLVDPVLMRRNSSEVVGWDRGTVKEGSKPNA